MGFRVSCECGECLTVQGSDAGSAVSCRCGRRVVVPLVEELQTGRVLVSAATIERRIRRMIASGDLPADPLCARCGSPDVAGAVIADVECERYRVRTSGGFRFLPIPGLFWVYWREENRTEKLGHDTDVRVAFYLCDGCRQQLRNPGRVAYLVVGAVLIAAVALVAYLISWVGVLLFPLALGVPWWLRRRALGRRQRAVKQALRGVPVYRQLLNRYPQAVVVIPKEGQGG
jgi:hypothetical protein